MELKTQALDRLLEALSPALSAELDRVVQETQENLEKEFQKRLQSAVRDAESAAQSAAAAELKRAVAEAAETTKKKVTEELEKQFAAKLADTTAQLQKQASSDRAQIQEERAAERQRLQEQLDQWRVFAETQRQLAEASSQPEILSRFLKLAQPFADGLAVYVAKTDGLALWKSRGKGAFPEIISQETTDPESYFKTIIVRGKAVAAICAMPHFKSEALDFLSASLERAIEVFGLKLRAPVPKPAVSETTAAVSPPPTAAARPLQAAAQLGPEDQKAHAEARRTARLLVSEIKLYHEEELQSGRQNGDIYQRLQKEIDLGREMYSHRVPSGVLASHDYFHEELVRILGENDASRLGAAYPGPMHS